MSIIIKILTNVSSVVSNHVLVVVDSAKRNAPLLVCVAWHHKQLLQEEKEKESVNSTEVLVCYDPSQPHFSLFIVLIMFGTHIHKIYHSSIIRMVS